jgi:hypothetical protein
MVEWFIAPVLKTGEPKGSAGSNPAPSATLGFQSFPSENSVVLVYASKSDAELGPLRRLAVLDEVQRAPRLFPALRLLLDRPEIPARFLLLGSASPHLPKGVPEPSPGELPGLKCRDS